jgi:hypothetical protein
VRLVNVDRKARKVRIIEIAKVGTTEEIEIAKVGTTEEIEIAKVGTTEEIFTIFFVFYLLLFY